MGIQLIIVKQRNGDMTAKKKNQSSTAGSGTRRDLPPGVKLLRTLKGHEGIVLSVASDPQGEMLASGSADKTVKLWEASSGKLLRTLEGHKGAVWSVAFDPQGETLASGSDDKTVKLWDVRCGKLLRTLEGHQSRVYGVVFSPQSKTLASSGYQDCRVYLWKVGGKLHHTLESHQGFVTDVAFDPQGDTLASGSNDKTVRLWDARSGKLLRTLKGHGNTIRRLAFDPQGGTLASGSDDHTVRLWDARSGKLLRTLEGHTGRVEGIAFSPDGRLLTSKSDDHTICLWSCETWETVAVIPEPTRGFLWIPALAFHPTLPLLAAAGSEPDTPDHERSRLIHLWELDYDVLLGQKAEPSAHYINAKVVLVGDTGVGKTGLSLVLNNQPFKATDSTPGRRVWTFDSQETPVGKNVIQTRETLLWDLAGQPGYRVIHQLHLNEVAVALVVFDARSETDPLAGVRHWAVSYTHLTLPTN